MAADLALEIAVTQVAWKDAAGAAEDHADEKDDGGGNDDDGPGRELGKEGGDGRAEPSGSGTNDGGEPEHVAEVVCPEPGRGGGGDEEGDDEDEPHGLQSDDGHGGDESHEEDVEREGGPAFGGGEIGVEAEEGEFLQEKKADKGRNRDRCQRLSMG